MKPQGNGRRPGSHIRLPERKPSRAATQEEIVRAMKEERKISDEKLFNEGLHRVYQKAAADSLAASIETILLQKEKIRPDIVKQLRGIIPEKATNLALSHEQRDKLATLYIDALKQLHEANSAAK